MKAFKALTLQTQSVILDDSTNCCPTWYQKWRLLVLSYVHSKYCTRDPSLLPQRGKRKEKEMMLR